MEKIAEKYLALSLKTIRQWLSVDHGEMMSVYEKRGGYVVEEKDGLVYCLFTLPFLLADGTRARRYVADPAVELVPAFVFAKDMVIADICAYHMTSVELFNPKVFSCLGQESDWLYWEAEILGELLYGNAFTCQEKDIAREEEVDILLYSNMYVSVDYRRKGIARHMMSMVERAVSTRGDYGVVCSCISLDPDLPCYGPDKIETSYVYSMKDEPARILNARIIERLGFEALRLETDEEVDDGSLLWFAVRKQAYMFV